MVLVGLGGTQAELLHDTAVVAPMTDDDVGKSSARRRALLLGIEVNGVDVPAVESLLLRIGALAYWVPELELISNLRQAGSGRRHCR